MESILKLFKNLLVSKEVINFMRKQVLLLVLPAMLLTSCKAAAAIVGDVTIRDVVYDTERGAVTWRIVKSGFAEVSNYSVSINDGPEQPRYGNGSTAEFPYDANGEDFKIRIVANTNLSETKDYEATFHCLGTVTGLRIEEGAIKWDALPEVYSYTVKNDNRIVAESVATTAYDLTPGEAFSVSVRPSINKDANGNTTTYAYWSETKRGTLLGVPANLAYDGEKVTWNSVRSAASYELTINGEKVESTRNEYPLPNRTTDLSFAVRALGDNETIFDSAWSKSENYKYLAPVELRCEDGKIRFEASAGADFYLVQVTGRSTPTKVTDCEFGDITPGVATTVKVLPQTEDGKSFSQWSAPITVTILPKPSYVTYESNSFRWGVVSGAASYGIKIVYNGEVVFDNNVPNDTYVYNYDFEKVGAYQVYVKANSDNSEGGIYSSQYSDPLLVNRLAAPTGVRIENYALRNNQLNIRLSEGVDHASGYQLFANNHDLGVTSNGIWEKDIDIFSDDPYENTINFQIFTKGNASFSPVYLDSSVSYDFSCTQLAMPQNFKVAAAELTWDFVSKAEQYIVTIDGDGDNRRSVNGTSYPLSTLTAGTHVAYVQAAGTEGNTSIIPSKKTDTVTFTKLAAPVIQTVYYNEQQGHYLMRWNDIQQASSYVVKVGNTELESTTNTFFDLTSYETYLTKGQGAGITVKAIGNGADIIDSDFADAKTIIRFNDPRDLALNPTGDSIDWNADSVDSKTPSDYYYQIDNGEVQVCQGKSLPTADLPVGEHTIRVKSKGQYFDYTVSSDWTAPLSFRKLAAVDENTITRDGNTISWDPVDGANYGYTVTFPNGDKQHVATASIDVTGRFTNSVGLNLRMSIKTDGSAANNVLGNEMSFTQDVFKLDTPIRRLSTNVSPEQLVEGEYTYTQDGEYITFYVHPLESTSAKRYMFKAGTMEVEMTDTDEFGNFTYKYRLNTFGTSESISIWYEADCFINDSYFISSIKDTKSYTAR